MLAQQPSQLKAAGVSHKADGDQGEEQAEVQELLLSLMNDGMLYFLGDMEDDVAALSDDDGSVDVEPQPEK